MASSRPAHRPTAGHGRKAKQAAILKALKQGNTRKAAAAYAGVNQDTFYEWLKQPSFSEAVMHAEANAEVAWETGIAAAGKKDWRALAFLLERRFGADWREKKDVNLRTLPTDQLLALIEECEGRIESAGDRAAQKSDESPALSE